mmetsp:Transcript_7376/g.7564  ORF Transcript_7376/g.7564 Transcript_7376/m.7564 type:complete len:82 (-) Transcript_7376:5-250(-)
MLPRLLDSAFVYGVLVWLQQLLSFCSFSSSCFYTFWCLGFACFSFFLGSFYLGKSSVLRTSHSDVSPLGVPEKHTSKTGHL